MTILGLNAYHGDAAAAVVRDGMLLGAVAEERFTRRKHEGGFPHASAEWCAGLLDGPPDVIAIGRNPRLHRHRKLLALLRHPRLWRRVPERLKNAEALSDLPRILQTLFQGHPPLSHVEHHRAHLTSAFFTGPFEHCALLSLDGFGDFVSTAWGRGDKRGVTISRRVFFPHSLGLLYTAITQFLGFDQYGEEYKVMALAAYGRPCYRHLFDRLARTTPRGFELSPQYFEHTRNGISMTFGEGSPALGRVFHARLQTLFGTPRTRHDPLTKHHLDLAASLQATTEDILLHLAQLVRDETHEDSVALAGGVALNSVANGVLLRSGIFRHVWIPSAPADDGTAIGAAAAVALTHGEGAPPRRENATPFLGPAYLATRITSSGKYTREHLQEDDLLHHAVELLEKGQIVGWFEGQTEFGPRALGHRSILADPRQPSMKDRLNRLVKRREAFRPFAPMVLAEDAAEVFDLSEPSPTMMIVAPVRDAWRPRLPAITHVDGSARVQTVDPGEQPRLAALLRVWKARSGVGVLLNTSFNENEPLVLTPDEALACFDRTGMDALVLESSLVIRENKQELAVARQFPTREHVSP